MRKPVLLLGVLALGLGLNASLGAQPGAAREQTRTYKARVNSQKNRGERSYTCRGEAKQDSVTKGAAYGGAGGLLLGGGVGGAILGAAAGAGVQHLQNNAACGR